MKSKFESDPLMALIVRMPLSRYFILRELCEGSKTQSELADVAEVSTASMTGIRDFLLKNGLIVSHTTDMDEPASDRRRVVSTITEKGRDVVAAYEKLATEILKARK